MGLNHDAVGHSFDLGERSWDSSAPILYALGVGAGADDPTSELAFTTENSEGVEQQVLPTFGVMIASREGKPQLGDFPLSKMLHAEQSVELFGPLPVEGTARTTWKLLGFRDKGTDALAQIESTMTDAATGELLAVALSTVFIRGEGGFGGERGNTPEWALPDRPADHVVSYRTRIDQALLYRLSNDRNPLHSDPVFAARAGFDRPILHGLCTYGFTGRAVLHAVCGGDPETFGSMSVRFASPVMPGEELSVHIWEDAEGAVFQTRVGDRLVLDRGRFARTTS